MIFPEGICREDVAVLSNQRIAVKLGPQVLIILYLSWEKTCMAGLFIQQATAVGSRLRRLLELLPILVGRQFRVLAE